MIASRVCIAVIALAELMGTRARAGIVPLEDQRFLALTCVVRAGGADLCSGSTDVFEIPATPFGAFSGSVGAIDSSAAQVSRVEDTFLSGYGTTGTHGGGGAPAESRFQVVFTVDEPSTYAFSGDLYSAWQLIGETEYRLVDMPDERNASLQRGAIDLFRTHEREFSNSGLLLPGERYTLSVWNRNQGEQFYGGGWEFTFSVAAAPEPSAATALVMLMVLSAVRRRIVA